jgi:hypothetical protein
MTKKDFIKKRKHPFREEKKSFLILCEGKNTEVLYFQSFHLVTAFIHVLKVRHGNVITFVNNCIEYKTNSIKKYDENWVVFDKDDSIDEDFNHAIELAMKNGFKVAYSNQAFEFWLLLHFNFHSGKMERSRYKTLLTWYLNFPYKKDEKTSKRIFPNLINKVEIAIENAERIYLQFNEPRNPAREESSSTVYLLAKEILKYK